jgi:hypothetical protein
MLLESAPNLSNIYVRPLVRLIEQILTAR